MRDMIYRQDAINAFRNVNLNIIQGGAAVGRRSYMTPKEAVKIIENLPSAQPVDKDINVPVNDCVSRAAAIDSMCELMHHWFGSDPKDEIREIKRELGKLPSAQPDPDKLHPKVDPNFSSCSHCANSEDSEEICILRKCVHAIAELKECYKRGDSMADLKPCPFCGRTPVIEDCGTNRYFIRCKCGIAQDKLYAQRCDAIRRWNTRKYAERRENDHTG